MLAVVLVLDLVLFSCLQETEASFSKRLGLDVNVIAKLCSWQSQMKGRSSVLCPCTG